jgi:hypothetical protein
VQNASSVARTRNNRPHQHGSQCLLIESNGSHGVATDHDQVGYERTRQPNEVPAVWAAGAVGAWAVEAIDWIRGNFRLQISLFFKDESILTSSAIK